MAGEPQTNVIPSGAEVVVDARLIPGLAPETVLARLEDLGRRAEATWPGLRVGVEAVAPPRPATRVDRDEPVVRALHWAMAAVTGRRPRYGGVPGSTDGTILHTEAGIPIVTCGPGNRRIPHQVDEHVEVEALHDAARAYAAASLRYLAAPPT